MKVIHFFKLDIDNRRIFGLDLLRMLAVLFVVFSHSASILPPEIYQFINLFYFDGVCIFFVLSGFLIGHILITSVEKKGFGGTELFTFWIRRWFRTLPNYYLFVIILGVLSKIFIDGFPLRAVLPFLIFCQNLVKSNESFFGESWSLSVEEWFYISIPLLLFVFVNLFKIRFKKSLIILSVTMLLFSTFLRLYMFTNGELHEMGDYRRVVIMRMDNLMYGVIGAYISYYYLNFWTQYRKASLILGIILILIWKFYSERYSIQSFYYSNIYYPLLCTSIFLMLPFMSSYRVKKNNTLTHAVTYISLISYSLYLIHYSLIKKLFIDVILADCFDGSVSSVIIKNAFYWSTSLIGALLIYKYFEIPTMKLRDKIKLK